MSMSSFAPSPRPILKRSATTSHSHSAHAVHFPPHTALTRTFSVHSATTYDRSPIVVAPNSCALPERGCPGRTYTLDDPASPPTPTRGHPYGGRVLHPRALPYNAPSSSRQRNDILDDADRTPTRTYAPLPPLIPDLSSESDESDGFSSPLPEPYAPATHHIHGLAIPSAHHVKYTSFDSYENGDATPSPLSFLPYAPSSPQHQYSYYLSHGDDGQIPRRRRSRERKHESSRDPDRIRTDSDSQESGRPSRSTKSRGSGSHRSMSICRTLSTFTIQDDGCLGGF